MLVTQWRARCIILTFVTCQLMCQTYNHLSADQIQQLSQKLENRNSINTVKERSDKAKRKRLRLSIIPQAERFSQAMRIYLLC